MKYLRTKFLHRLFSASLSVGAVCAVFAGTLSAATIEVNDGSSLQAAINGATGGDTIIVNEGTYDSILLFDRNFTEDQPLIIKSGTGTPTITRTTSSGKAVYLDNISYVVLDGLKIVGGVWGYMEIMLITLLLRIAR